MRSDTPRWTVPARAVLVACCLSTASLGATAGSDIDPATWIDDVTYLLEEVESIHPNPYHRTSRDDWEAAAGDLRETLQTCTLPEAIFGFKRLAALLGDGHSRIQIPARYRQGQQWLPIHSHVFSDGLYLRTAHRDYADWFGHRIVEVEGMAIDEVFEALLPFIPHDNLMGAIDTFPHYLRDPMALKAAGITDHVADQVEFLFEDDSGERSSVTIHANSDSWITNEWRDSDFKSDKPKPLYRTADGNYSMHHVEKDRILYVYFDSVRDDDQETIAQFAERVFTYIDQNEIDRFVFDIRENGGGNNYLNQPWVHGFISNKKINQPGKLFVITGRDTFSAAMCLAMELELNTHALFVGEATGATPNHYGDTRNVVLPESGLTLRCSELYWQNSDPRDQRQWITPDLPAEPSFVDFFSRRDPAMEAIRGYSADSTGELPAPNTRWGRPSQYPVVGMGEAWPGAASLSALMPAQD